MEDWQRILQVRSLVLSKKETLQGWIKFASICRKNGKMMLSERILLDLLNQDPNSSPTNPLSTAFPQVKIAYFSFALSICLQISFLLPPSLPPSLHFSPSLSSLSRWLLHTWSTSGTPVSATMPLTSWVGLWSSFSPWSNQLNLVSLEPARNHCCRQGASRHC